MRMISVMILTAMACAALHSEEVNYIEDAAILKSLTATVTKMKDDGKLKPGKEMLEACKGGKAKVELGKKSDAKMDPAAIYKNLRKNILVHCKSYKCGKCTKLHMNCSTTYAIAKDVVVFNYHAIDGNDESYHAVADSDGNAYAVTEVLAYDKDNDICIAKVEGASFDPLPLIPDEPVGTPVVVVSHPDGMYYVMTQGNISRYYASKCSCGKKTCTKSKGNWMSITADYAKGSSGAPILNMNGCVAGMVSSTRSIYYNEVKGVHENLQMVVKSCVPSSFILKLVENTAK